MTDEPALLAAIRAAPDDDAPRLVYADWLDEHGRPEQAELIRRSMRQARLTGDEQREARMATCLFLGAHAAVLQGRLATPGVVYVWQRGFISRFDHDGAFVGGNPGRHVLRFYSDGHVIGDTVADTWDARRRMNRHRPEVPCGTYTLDTLEYPARLRFTLTGPDGPSDFEGVMEGAWLVLDRHDRAADRRTRDHYRLDPEAGPDRYGDPDPNELATFVDSPLDDNPPGEGPTP